VHPGGVLIAAGIIADQELEVVAALEQEELGLLERRQRDDWVCLVTKQGYLPD